MPYAARVLADMKPPACQVHHPYTDTGTLHPDDLADLHRSGLSDGTIAAMGCRSVNQREIKKLTGVKVATGGYLLPYRDVLDQTGRPYSRVRLRNASKDLRYISGVGDDPQVYVPLTEQTPQIRNCSKLHVGTA